MTSTELVEVVNPATGESVELASETTDRIAAERRGVTDLKRALDQYASHLDDELTRRLDRMGRRSADVGGWTIETKAPTTTDYPVDALRGALEDLIDADLLDEAVRDDLIVPTTTYKLNRTRLNTLLKHPDERVREALAACAVESEVARRTVTVKEPGV
jgi:hypothetical protein